jgi:hypothetical protein
MLALTATLLSASVAVHASDCAGGVDATGNDCSGSVPTPPANQGDVRKADIAQAEARLASLRAAVKQYEMKVVIAKTTLIGVEGQLTKSRGALQEEEAAQAMAEGVLARPAFVKK